MKLSNHTKSSKHPTSFDIYWVSGVYEGEGSCYQKNGTDKYAGAIEVEISQKSPEILYRIRELFGGTVNKHANRNLYFWRIYGTQARGFLMTIYFIMSSKRKYEIRKVLSDWKGQKFTIQHTWDDIPLKIVNSGNEHQVTNFEEFLPK